MPEVLALDAGLVKEIRKNARISVIGSTLFLHVCNISGIPASQLSLSSKSQCHMNKVESLLKTNPSYDLLSEGLMLFIEDIIKKTLEPEKVSFYRNLTERVCIGNDPVFKLLDNRVRQFFKFSCKFNSDASRTAKGRAPRSMKTGICNLEVEPISNEYRSPAKAHFLVQGQREAKKLGLNFISDDLVKTAYKASNAINHCVYLYGKDVLLPMLRQMIAINLDE